MHHRSHCHGNRYYTCAIDDYKFLQHEESCFCEQFNMLVEGLIQLQANISGITFAILTFACMGKLCKLIILQHCLQVSCAAAVELVTISGYLIGLFYSACA